MSIKLNPNQKEAVEYSGLKPLLIEAGAGSGKTRVMSERVKYLLEEGRDPESFLICTFSIKAADELKNRLLEYALDNSSSITKADINKMTISTIHSFCLNLIDEKEKNLDIYSDNEKKLMFIYKHKEELGFVNEAHISRNTVKNIADKFSEFTEFEVDLDELARYANINFPISDEYRRIINENEVFPYDEVNKDTDLKESWYNAQYIQIIKAYPIYLKLLEENNGIDYSLMQAKALEVLTENNNTKFKNILVDEFQDTDPTQFSIFEILMNETLKNNKENHIEGTFTVVGDINQKIYGFRGAVQNYFEELYRKYDCKVLSLDTNHRSVENIIRLTENFIKDNNESISKNKIKVFRKDSNRDTYYLINENSETEAMNIAKIIKELVESGKAEYKDILILFRSVKYSAKELIAEFKDKKIPFHVKGFGDLTDIDEIKSILTLLDFIVDTDEGIPIYSPQWKWLNPKAFTDEDFNQKMANLSYETKEILKYIQDKYENDVLTVGKRVQNELNASSKKRSFSGMFNHDEEIKKAIFSEVHKPVLTKEFLKESGVTNKEDLDYFAKLNNIKKDYFDKDYDERESILEIYYKLLDIGGYLNDEFISNPENKEAIESIAILTNIIDNYETVVSKTDLRGLYWYLRSFLKEYGIDTVNEDGVQIMTVHKSKGLEYPVTILASLQKDKFPRKYKDEEESNKKDYYVPNKFLTTKIPHSEEEKNHYAEEDRVIYVAMTRAQDTLILSTIPPKTKNEEEKNKIPSNIKDLIENNPTYIKKLDMDKLDVIEKIEHRNYKTAEKRISLSYSSLDTYKACPLVYHLKNDLKFKTPKDENINYGNIIHNSLDQINKIVKEDKEITEKDIILLVAKTYDKYLNDKINPFKKQETIENVLYYWNNYGKKLNVLDSEYKFNIYKDNYNLNGAIDLIYETKDGKLGIIDYKNAMTIDDYKIKKYREQIQTYILALKEDPEYCDKEIGETKIYGTYKRQMYDLDLNKNKINEENIDKISKNIKKEHFDKKVKEHCSWCTFNFICLKNRCSICGKPILNNREICRECESD